VASALVDSLFAVLATPEPLVIVPHDNPDPDAISSAAALKHLCARHLSKDVTIALGGIVARAENRAMLTYLDIELVAIDTVDFRSPCQIALVDTQPGRRNNSLPQSRRPIVVIDHHPAYADYADIPFVDLREYGATAAILTEYLFDSGTVIDSRVATALFYGIAAETQDLGREATGADVAASQRLYPYTNKRRLAKIENARVPAAYFRTFRDAIESALVVGKLVICELGEVPYPDLAAEAADFLLRLEDIRWAAVMALHDGKIYVSVRTTDRDANAGELLRKVLGSRSAGGHGMIAGGTIVPGEGGVETALARIRDRLIKHLGVDGRPATPLIQCG